MKINPITGSLLVSSLAAVMLWAGEPWKEKPSTEWTEKEVKKILGDSPWSRPVKKNMGPRPAPQRPPSQPVQRRVGTVYDASGRPIPVYEERNRPLNSPDDLRGAPGVLRQLFVVRWASSSTVREAIVRQRQLLGISDQEKDTALLSQMPTEHVIVVSGMMGGFLGLTEDILRGKAQLELMPRKKKISPQAVRFVWDTGQLLAVEFYFPRELEGVGLIGLAGERIRFYCPTTIADIKVDFDLRKMVRDGKPDL
jgi:hypothetical protein